MRGRKSNADLELADIRNKIIKHREKGLILISHFNKMQEYYEQWETELNEIQEAITKISEEHGVSTKEVEQYDALADVFGE